MKTENCPKCDSTKIVHRFGGINLTKEQKETMICLDCAYSFNEKNTIIKEWEILSTHEKGR